MATESWQAISAGCADVSGAAIMPTRRFFGAPRASCAHSNARHPVHRPAARGPLRLPVRCRPSDAALRAEAARASVAGLGPGAGTSTIPSPRSERRPGVALARRQRIAACQADTRRFVEVTALSERELRSGIEFIVGATHRAAIERDFDEVTLRRLIELLSC
ncbi:MAG: hypothetical protein R3F49_24035 [Planctomycetota bacterium]